MDNLKHFARRLGFYSEMSRRLGLFDFIQARWNRYTLTRRLPKGGTVLVHIGKCGGRTLKLGIKHAQHHNDIQICYIAHAQSAIYRDDLSYIIIARGPVSRVISAFSQGHQLVVTEGSARDRIPGEYEVFVKYETLNNLAEILYDEDGRPNADAHQDARLIHHIREDITFYLDDLLQKCRPDQIRAVLMQENLNADIKRVFGYENELHEHRNPKSGVEKLSRRGLANLMRFLHRDYEILTRLYCWGKIENDTFVQMIQNDLGKADR